MCQTVQTAALLRNRRINYPLCTCSYEWTNHDRVLSSILALVCLPQPLEEDLHKMASVCCRILVSRDHSLSLVCLKFERKAMNDLEHT